MNRTVKLSFPHFTKAIKCVYAFITMIFLVSCWKAIVIGDDLSQFHLRDGTYNGSSSHGPNKSVVRVTISGNRITLIEVLQSRGTKNSRVVQVIPGRIINQQSTRVDAVSGATNSSNVLMNAVQNAVEQAIIRTF